MRYVYGEDEQGRTIDVADPLAPTFAKIAAAHRGDPAGFAHALFAIHSIFDEDLQNEPRFTAPVVRWLESLFASGARKSVAKAVQ